MIRNLVLSGGAVRTVAAVGCLKYLHDHKLLDHVTTIVGTSAGAILGFLMALGNPPDKIVSLLKDVLIGKGYHRINFDELLQLNVWQSFGLDSGSGITNFLEDVLEKTLGCRDITFLDFTKKQGINFVVGVANLSKQETEYMCVDETPDMSVVTAVRMSSSLPILFVPIRHSSGDLYIDGGLYETLPIGYISKKFSYDMLRDTLAISTMRTNQNRDLSNLPSYLSALVGGLLSKVNENAKAICLDKIKQKIRVFEVDGGEAASVDLFCFDMENLNFDIDCGRIDIAVQHGYNAMAKDIAENLV